MGETSTFDTDSFVKWTLGLVFAGVLVTANLTASKLVVYDIPFLGTFTGSVAAVAIGVNFFCTDLLSEVYGKKTARRVVNGTIFALIAAYALVAFAVWMPPAESYANNSQFSTIFNSSYPIILASIVSILVSQNLDVTIFHRFKSMTDGKHKWFRNLGSTATSQLLDTAFFTWLAFILLPPLFGGSALPYSVAASIIFAEYMVKLTVAAIDTPFFYAASGYLGCLDPENDEA
ncbi:hypothetical protein DNAM5_66 [Haloarcula californiae tailed virus 1]|uniref:Queuosine precursor transporter n=1 Tax=Haloarcula californiae tailed virus 1 TaxID=1273746 RepID=R4TNY5_9CAUD|nr:hypothetical protein M202_gp150 [Haloarcula californiae tailed virus 1]AGM11928.1 hypothetical protein DNAM5_66 [Haloarcula californiae tailed virus 1]